MKQYIIITPCKNEERNLPGLVRSLEKQSITPVLWAIIDDGSTDKTLEIIQDIENKHQWAENISLKKSYRDLTIHISDVIKTGFDFAKNFCMHHEIRFDYIVFLDADMVIDDAEFFQKLISEFEKDENLGIASGEMQYLNALGELFNANGRSDTISGGEMMCRRECIEEIDGIPISHAWESAMRVKAKLKGWKIKRFASIKIIHTRDTGSAEGLKKGYYLKGTSEYYLDMNPFIVISKGFIYCFKRPYYLGFAYLSGYINSWIRRKEKTNDREVREYYYYRKPYEIWQYLVENMLRRKS
ncbi:MAG: glycosyltransferase family 2 protein [Candidatus Methanoperedens sp.]